MKRYIIKYKGKEHISLGENSVDAVEKFLDRPVFGRTDWNGGFKLDMYDGHSRRTLVHRLCKMARCPNQCGACGG